MKLKEEELKIGLHVFINEDMEKTTKQYGTNIEMRRMAQSEKPFRIERIASSRLYVILINPITRNEYSFDREDIRLAECDDKTPQEFHFDESELLEV